MQVQKQDLVSVEQELKFTNDYLDLQKVRFDTSLMVSVNVPMDVLDRHLPAFAIQTLVENAVKHNSFTERRPLYIKILYSDNTITVSNNKTMTKAELTTGTGLKNLNERYKIIANREIIMVDEKDEFSVSIPLINDRVV
jgi:two-component system, LytTR family, sensor kinase